MPEPPPKGVKPMFLRGATLEKYGMKTGPGVSDVVDFKYLHKADIMKDIQMYGVMCDFEAIKKDIEAFHGDDILVVVDRESKYGETYLVCTTKEAIDEFMKGVLEQQEALQEQLREAQRIEDEKKAAEEARLNAVYEDKPLTPRPWQTSTCTDTETEVKLLTSEPSRDVISMEISRPKRLIKASYRFTDRNADIGGVAEFKAIKDPNFKIIREQERGIQVAPPVQPVAVQTTYYRAVNKAVQYESATMTTSTTASTGTGTGTDTGAGVAGSVAGGGVGGAGSPDGGGGGGSPPGTASNSSHGIAAGAGNSTANNAASTATAASNAANNVITNELLSFLEKATVKIEQALQQNESVDIFHDTFKRLAQTTGKGGSGSGAGGVDENAQNDNELRYLKNFADAIYSKNKPLVCIDWMPKAMGSMLAVSTVRNLTFDQRIPILGQTTTSYVLLWDFRLLVRPLLILQCPFEVFTMKFNPFNPYLIIGGTSSGQVVLWDITEAMNYALKKSNSSGSKGNGNNQGNSAANTAGSAASNLVPTVPEFGEDDATNPLSQPIHPKYISTVDHSHKRCVSDLFWLPSNTQMNYRGQLVGEEHLPSAEGGSGGQGGPLASYQFLSISGDGMMMVWDIRYEAIYNDELRHIGRMKHIPTEKTSNKEGGGFKPLWAPIFKTHLKRLEGVGELSLCKICETSNIRAPHSLHILPHHHSSAIVAASTTGGSKAASGSQHAAAVVAAASLGNTATTMGDYRSQFIIATEEGDIIFADLAARKNDSSNANTGGTGAAAAAAGGKEEEEDEDSEFSCVKWIVSDHARPCVSLQESPFFPHIILSISDWNFHIWKVGEDRPLFTSPLSHAYLTAGCWSTTRPAVILISCADGTILVWDFTDSSYKHSLQWKAAPYKIKSMELLKTTSGSNTTSSAAVNAAAAAAGGGGSSAGTTTGSAGAGGGAGGAASAAAAAGGGGGAAKYQLLAVGDEAGTLHIHEVPYNLTQKVNREELIMQKFLERDLERIELAKNNTDNEIPLIGSGHAAGGAGGGGGPSDQSMVGGGVGGHSRPGTTNDGAGGGANDGFALPGSPGGMTEGGNGVGGLGSSSAPGGTAAGSAGAGPGELSAMAKAELAALQKAEEEFLKLESIYIGEMGLLVDGGTGGGNDTTPSKGLKK